MPTKADFKAERERIGYTQAWVALACDVDIRTVKRWEKPGCPEPPEDAWMWLARESDRFDEMRDHMARKCVESGASRAILTYYRTQGQYDQLGREPGSYGFANALARAVGEDCLLEDMDVEYRYPDDGAIRTEGSRY